MTATETDQLAQGDSRPRGRGARMTATPCPTCRTIHCARDVVAVSRFDVHVPTRYMPNGGGITRATRAEAMADACADRTPPPVTYLAARRGEQTEESE